ncbi:MAG: hypothetical protein H7840_09875 [Alphaproteobacteria bacterium]
MTKKLLKDALLADLSAVNAILSSLQEDDYVGRMGFEARKEEIETELAGLERSRDTLANVALMFYGKPVHGSRSIATEFAAKALASYQDLVAKHLATSETGGLAQRGPTPARQAANLNITGILHGSFGFLLEESDQDGPQLINSSLREAVDKVTDVLDHFAAESEDPFNTSLNEMDPRLFSSVKTFFKILHDDEATMRIVEGEKDRSFDAKAVDRAHQRCQNASIDEQDLTVTGTLIGVMPYARRFELRIEDTEVITGKVGPIISQEYLNRIETDERVIGRRWEARLFRKSVDRPGQRTQVTYTLLELKDL